MTLLQLFNRTWPIVFQQTGERSIGQQLAGGLAARAVIGFIFCVHDALDHRATDGTRLSMPAMNGHAFSKGCYLFRKAFADFLPESLGPFEQGLSRGLEQAADFGIGEFLR